jgi:hypothetical protein
MNAFRRFFYKDLPLVLNKGGMGKDAVATKVPTVITRGALSENCFLVLFDWRICKGMIPLKF